MNAFLGIALSWVLATNGVAVNLDHAAAVKVTSGYSSALGQTVYYVKTVSDVPGGPTYTLFVSTTPEEAAEYVAQLAR